MTINGINGTNAQAGQMGINPAMDSFSRNIQKQIANAQKQLQELSSKEDMTLEEKMKKRQEIQQQISDLNMQLRQHQIEQRKEQQQAKKSSADNAPDGTGSAGDANSEKNTGLSQAGMTAMLSADHSIKQAKVQGSVATSMEGRAGILECEIKLDSARGGNVEKKQKELADVEQKAQAATGSQLSALADADKTMKEAAEKDREAESADRKAEKTDNKDEKTTVAEAKASKEKEEAESAITPQQPTAHASVDIRL